MGNCLRLVCRYTLEIVGGYYAIVTPRNSHFPSENYTKNAEQAQFKLQMFPDLMRPARNMGLRSTGHWHCPAGRASPKYVRVHEYPLRQGRQACVFPVQSFVRPCFRPEQKHNGSVKIPGLGLNG